MRAIHSFLLVFICISWLGCNKNDDSVTSEIALKNEPPVSFSLMEVPDGAPDVDVAPILKWESAKNPKGSEITYDLYLGKEINPQIIYKSDISDTSYQITERLNLLTDYYWKVVATDTDGMTSQSSVQRFRTRNLNIPEEPLVDNTFFAPRSRHSTTVFDNKLWVTAGSSSAAENLRNDVWYSEDGIEWTEATAEAQFPKRNIHSAVAFDNKLWIIGGYDGDYANDVWFSADGINWSEAVEEAPFSPRFSHTLSVFDNKIWVIGGASEAGLNNDVWYSENGTDWVQATANASFPKMASHGTVVFEDKLLLFGGVLQGFIDYTNDVWQSEDGINWTKVTANSPLPSINGRRLLVFNDRLWLLGDARTRSQAWYSDDGKEWVQAYVQEALFKRNDYTANVFKGKIWLIAGQDNAVNQNDIWALD